MERHFMELLRARWDNDVFLCVGLDPVINRIPESVQTDPTEKTLRDFCCAIVDATHLFVGAFKPNAAFFERYGDEGWRALWQIVQHINQVAPNVPVILDAKRGDIGNTNNGYVEAIFDILGFDAVTLHPYLGEESLAPFLDREEKGCVLMGRTSNPGAGALQNLTVEGGDPLWLHVAKTVATQWNRNGNCGLVFGATRPEETTMARQAIGDEAFFLMPGIGAQGGDLEASVKAARDSLNRGFLLSASRGVIYAGDGPDFDEAAGREAQRLHTDILYVPTA